MPYVQRSLLHKSCLLDGHLGHCTKLNLNFRRLKIFAHGFLSAKPLKFIDPRKFEHIQYLLVTQRQKLGRSTVSQHCFHVCTCIALCVVEMCHLSNGSTICCSVEPALFSYVYMYCSLCCQDVSSFGNTPVKMCHLSDGSTICCSVEPALFSYVYMYCSLCCQDVSSFGNTPVKMCHLSAGSTVSCSVEPCSIVFMCVHALLLCCQDVSSFGNPPCQDVSSFGRKHCILSCRVMQHYFHVCTCIALCVVKMCHLLATHLSRCVIFRQEALYLVL